jgi:hypothetical protein
MHLIYMDEVKYQIPEQPYYWLCGFAVDKPALEFADAAARAAAEWYFGNSNLDPSTEFHGKHIVNGTSHFKGHEVARRIELYKKLIDCLCGHEAIQRIEVRIDPSKIVYAKDPAETAFMFFVERSDSLMKRNGSLGVLIADDDNKRTRSDNVSGLSHYRSWQTDWHFGRQIHNLVDTVHHTQSHHSRMVQLADIFVYACQLQQRENLPYIKKQVYDYAVEKKLYVASAYKYWPTNMSPCYQSYQRRAIDQNVS